MVEELKVRTHSLKLDNRATFFIGKQNLTPRLDKFIIIGGKDMETEVYVKLKTDKLDIETKAIRKGMLFDQIKEKILG